MWKVVGTVAAAMLLWSADVSATQLLHAETLDQARQRHSAQRWQEYEQRGYQAPLGGYSEPLGDPAPRGTERPGYTPPQGYGSPSSGYGRQQGSQFGR
jgi:hypothetical protein